MPKNTYKGQGNMRVYPGAGMGATRGYGVGTRDVKRNPKSGRRVIGQVYPGENIGLPVKGPTAPQSAATPKFNAAGSARLGVRSSTPTSILNSGRSYYGPLSYASANEENRPYATGGMAAGNRSRPKRSPDKGNPKQKGPVREPVRNFKKEY